MVQRALRFSQPGFGAEGTVVSAFPDADKSVIDSREEVGEVYEAVEEAGVFGFEG